jgi:hypothetical protein
MAQAAITTVKGKRLQSVAARGAVTTEAFTSSPLLQQPGVTINIPIESITGENDSFVRVELTQMVAVMLATDLAEAIKACSDNND